ncbi:Phosphorylase B Kinase Regulatory Subunit Alpha, Skeletal Muscle Isoform [Manis pentadactyla]|nr:Phosphorylase B Kinase Regulatory Subunit Alpha, Skeletal Muscle Isoform [Manis pentadactyla]
MFAKVQEYREALEAVLIKGKNGVPLLPELYSVPSDKIDEEYQNPHTVDRVPMGKLPPYVGSVSIHLRKFDGRVSILAETEEIKAILKDKGIDVETIARCTPSEYNQLVFSATFMPA